MDRYVERNEAGTLRVAGTGVTLSSVVHAFWRCDSPETIVQDFPTLTLERAYGAIAHYLAHREEIDRELAEQETKTEQPVLRPRT